MDRDRELHEMADEGRALMNDYIKREDAVKALAEYEAYDVTCETGIETTADDCVGTSAMVFEKIPPADVAPVRHGHWIKISPAGIYECSECGKNVMTSDIKAYEYCHGCGAKMDLED